MSLETNFYWRAHNLYIWFYFNPHLQLVMIYDDDDDDDVFLPRLTSCALDPLTLTTL